MRRPLAFRILAALVYSRPLCNPVWFSAYPDPDRTGPLPQRLARWLMWQVSDTPGIGNPKWQRVRIVKGRHSPS